MPAIITVSAINLDCLKRIKLFGKRGEEVPVEEIQIVPSGTVANVAVATASLLNPKLSLDSGLLETTTTASFSSRT